MIAPRPFRTAFLACAAASLCFIALALPAASGAPGSDTKVVLLAGVKSHAPGEHEYEKSLELFRHCLDTALNVRNLDI